MADVFVSYARADEEWAQRIADALRQAGYTVWRDDELPAHRTYADVIQERLKMAKAVVVLWSVKAAKSQWVRSEADAARQLGTLVQVAVDGSLPPMPFDQVQCANLSAWSGETSAPGWRRLVASVAELAGECPKIGESPKRRGTRNLSVCVLPFQNMSGDSEQEYFSDGITEDITTDLSKVSALEVIARNTAFQFKGKSIDVCEVAKKLGVSHILEGSVRKAGGRVRITAQLIDGGTGGHVWAERFDRDLIDVFEIQDEISRAIVDALKVRLLPAEKTALEQRQTTSFDAYNLYLIARRYFTSSYFGGGQQEEKIIRICNRAVELDPSFARAWGLLAWVQSMLFTYKKGGADGMAAAKRALSLDSTIAQAHCVLARRLREEGNEVEADEALREALKLEPQAWEVNREAGRALYNRNDFAQSVSYFEKALAIVEVDYSAWQMLASSYGALGQLDDMSLAAEKMLSHSQRILADDPANTEALATNACGMAIQSDATRFRERADLALLLDPANMLLRYNFACMAAAFLKDVDSAIDLLKPTFADDSGETFVEFALADPDLIEARKRTEFEDILAAARARTTSGEAITASTTE